MEIKKNNGMVLHLYKHLNGSMFADDPRPDKNQNDLERTMIAFGNFDRLCFSPVDRFVEFLSQSSEAYRWTGGRKDIMLYPLEADEHRHFVFGPKESGYVQPPFFVLEGDDTEVKCRRNFLLVSMLYVSGKAKASVKNYEDFLKYIQKAIYKIVSECNSKLKKMKRTPIVCEVFGTFNSSEIALLWAADQFADVQYIVDHIRHLRLELGSSGITEPVFISTYTIVALLDDSFDPTSIYGGAMIQLASAPNNSDATKYNSSQQYLLSIKKLKSIVVDCCAGEYDFIIESLPPELKLLLKPTDDNGNGWLHVDNETFKKVFSHSTTRLFYRMEDIPGDLQNLPWSDLLCVKIPELANNLSKLSKQWNAPRKIAGTTEDSLSYEFNSFKRRVLSKIKSTSTFGCNLDLLFSDFIQCVNTTHDRQWAEDLRTQLLAAIDVFNKYLDEYNMLGTTEVESCIGQDYIDRISLVLHILEKQIHHVSDAGKLFFEEPCSHSEATSQYDLLFHMYYGVAKYVLSTAYAARKDSAISSQSTLIPLIRFDPVPMLSSSLYFDLPDIDQRVIDISLPQNAWCEPGLYIPLLIHELYHYIAPVNRNERNEAFAKILLSELCVLATQLILKSARDYAIQKDKDLLIATASDDVFKRSLLRVIQFVRRTFIAYFQNTDLFKSIKSSEDMHWSDYSELLSQWIVDQTVEDDSSFMTCFSNALEYMGKILISELENTATQELDKALFLVLIKDVTKTPYDVKYTSLEKLPNITEYLHPAYMQIWQSIGNQLHELAPDVSMVQLSKINAVDYMLIFASTLDKMLGRPGDLREEDCDLSLRVGFILDYVIGIATADAKERLKALLQYRNEFQKKYTAHVENSRWSDDNKEDNPLTCAGKWFSFFVDQYEDYLTKYAPYHDLLNELANKQFTPLCAAGKKNLIAEYSKKYFSALSAEDHMHAIFQCNKEYIYTFQAQPFLSDLCVPDINQKIVDAKEKLCWKVPRVDLSSKTKPKENWSITRSIEHVEPIAAVSEYLVNTHQKVFGTGPEKCELWYRGSQNSDYAVLPSIMVHFLDKNQISNAITKSGIKGVNSQGTLWDYQRSILERFKNKADGAPEFINGASYTASDYIALMQHYGQYTCYLDWSEDVYSSLYFALEDEIDEKEKKHGGHDASLYILDPMLYNRARKKMIDRIADLNPEMFCPNDSWMHNQAKHIQDMPDGYIPNLSLAYNRDRFGLFSFDVPEHEDVNINRSTHYLTCSGKAKDATLSEFELEMWNLPLAVYTSRLNPRIRSQSGQFMAFSPFSIPVYSEKLENSVVPSADRFAYLSLLKIQDYFLKCFEDEEPFMYEVKIRAFAREQMGSYLRKVGINRYRIYPELGNLKKF